MWSKLFIAAIFLSFKASGQQYSNNWVFGDSVLLSFTDTGITCMQIPSTIQQEASASISDSDGNLLFYTDGKYVWNKNLNLMPNGCCLNIDQYWTYASSVTQGVLILPNPNQPTSYYIVTLAEDTMSFSLVDMSLDSGYGDVYLQNQAIFSDTLMEKMHAVKHANGRDWWVIVHERIPSFDPGLTNRFYRILITPEGVLGPFEQNIGALIDYYTMWGEMVFSPDGSMLALSGYNFLELFNFDRCSGELTTFARIDNFDEAVFDAYGVSFSPFDKIYQYCIDCLGSIEDTKVLVFDNFYGEYINGQLEIGPDRKIYFVIAYKWVPNNEFTYKNMNLCVINEPNLEGLACDIDTSTIWLGGRRAIAGLPNMVNYNLGALVGSDCDTLGVAIIEPVSDKVFTVFPNPVVDVVYFRQSTQTNTTFYLRITNAAGILVYNNPEYKNSQQVNLLDIPAGLYQYSINNADNFHQSGSFVKIE
jgi:hypothetical protein